MLNFMFSIPDGIYSNSVVFEINNKSSPFQIDIILKIHEYFMNEVQWSITYCQ